MRCVLSKEDLEAILGSELAYDIVAAPTTGFFIVSQYDSVAKIRLEPLSVVAVDSMEEAAALYAKTLPKIGKHAVLVEPCWDIVISQ